jgi:SulP family sulfate permease
LVSIVSFGITILLPKLTPRAPAAITGILCGTAFEWLIVRLAIKSGTILIGDLGIIGGHFPYPVWFDPEYIMPAPSFEMFKSVFKTSFMMAVIGLLESVMTLNILNEMTKSNGNILRECIGQGVANIVTGAFGGMGGCAMLGQSIINVSSGARGRTSSFVAGMCVLFVLLVAYRVVQYVPMAALAGVMYNVVIQTFEWHTLQLIFFSPLPRRFKQRWFPSLVDKKIRRADVLVMVVVVVVALVEDLFWAVIAGSVLACLLFVYDAADIISVSSRTEGESKYYSVRGTLFFGSASNFLQLFDYQGDPHDVHVVFEASYITDFTAIESLNKLAERYHELGKHITLHKAHSQKIVAKAKNLLVEELTLAEDAEDTGLRSRLSEASLTERSRGWAFLDGSGIPAAENVEELTDHDRGAENQAEHDTPVRFV